MFSDGLREFCGAKYAVTFCKYEIHWTVQYVRICLLSSSTGNELLEQTINKRSSRTDNHIAHQHVNSECTWSKYS